MATSNGHSDSDGHAATAAAVYEDAESLESVLKELNTDPERGLTKGEAAERLVLHGPNKLQESKKAPLWLAFARQFKNVVVLMLLGACVISLALGEVVEGVAIIIIVTLNASIAVFTEKSADEALAALMELSQPISRVIRGGETVSVPSSDLVPGDIVLLETGDVTPADCFLMSSVDMRVNEALLTGESVDVNKAPIPEHKEEKKEDKEKKETLTPSHMVFSSCIVTNGRGVAVCTSTGMGTRVGKIAHLLFSADEADSKYGKKKKKKKNCLHEKLCGVFTCLDIYETPRKTPLQKDLHNLGTRIGVCAISACVLVFIVGVVRGHEDPEHPDNPVVVQMVLTAVSLAVSAIPEGLPLVVTICMALGTQRLAHKHALVRRLPAVETLGATNIICTDKTGTLTTGKMTAVRMYSAFRYFNITGMTAAGSGSTVASQLQGKIIDESTGNEVDGENRKPDACVATTMTVSALCSHAEFVTDKDGVMKAHGNSTELPLVASCYKYGLDVVETREAYEMVDEVPFSSSAKMMVTVHQVPEKPPQGLKIAPTVPKGAKYMLAVKGAPSVLLKRCDSYISSSGKVKPLSEENRKQVDKVVDDMSSEALRVLAVTMSYRNEMPWAEDADPKAKLDEAKKNLIFCGLFGVMDPPRHGVKRAIGKATEAGIRTIMITGDFLETAKAIARQIDLLTSDDTEDSATDCAALREKGTGAYLIDSELDEITARVNVFARAQPEDKLAIVQSLQRQGHTCAMTGDGVNDAPALKCAQIGVAMGTGTSVAKAAAEIVLTDDNFCSIVEAVEEGRSIYANIRKFLVYLLGTNSTQVIVIFSCVLFGLPTPLTPLQILFINLATDGLPAISLSFEKPDAQTMQMPPRSKNTFIMSGIYARSSFLHALALAVAMTMTFVVGLYWNIGNVFQENFTMGDCTVMGESGKWTDKNEPNCVQDGVRKARTMAFLAMCVGENLRVFTVRSTSMGFWVDFTSNKWTIRSALLSLLLAVVVITVPGVNNIFGLTTLPQHMWMFTSFIVIVITVGVDEWHKNSLRASDDMERHQARMQHSMETLHQAVAGLRSHLVTIENTTQKQAKAVHHFRHVSRVPMLSHNRTVSFMAPDLRLSQQPSLYDLLGKVEPKERDENSSSDTDSEDEEDEKEKEKEADEEAEWRLRRRSMSMPLRMLSPRSADAKAKQDALLGQENSNGGRASGGQSMMVDLELHEVREEP